MSEIFVLLHNISYMTGIWQHEIEEWNKTEYHTQVSKGALVLDLLIILKIYGIT
jgi:hypothetical protein